MYVPSGLNTVCVKYSFNALGVVRARSKSLKSQNRLASSEKAPTANRYLPESMPSLITGSYKVVLTYCRLGFQPFAVTVDRD